jgi:hypothetical protein
LSSEGFFFLTDLSSPSLNVLQRLFVIPSIVNTVETMPPIGNADQDIVYAECALSLKRNKKINRKIYRHKKANWRSIRKDVNKRTQKIKGHYHKSSTNNLCSTFKDGLLKSVKR